MAKADFKFVVFLLVSLCATFVSCSRSQQSRSAVVEASNTPPSSAVNPVRTAEPKNQQTQSVEPQVQSEIERLEAAKRASLLQDAVAALADTRIALAALDNGDKNAALSALERASGKLDLVLSRDPHLAFAPVDVTTTIFDLYGTPETVKNLINQCKDDLSRDRVQQARLLMMNLASEADTHVVEIPLATYPAAIKAVAPLIDAGKLNQAIAALETALNTMVIQTYVIPLPRVRAEALLAEANQLASNTNRASPGNQTVHDLLEAARTQLQLAEALGYGNKEEYKPLYAQLDDVEKKAESGKTNEGLFNRIEDSLRRFKFST